jgi:hypothetical protein
MGWMTARRFGTIRSGSSGYRSHPNRRKGLQADRFESG